MKRKNDGMDGLTEALGLFRSMLYLVVGIVGKIAKAGAQGEKLMREQTLAFVSEMFGASCADSLLKLFGAIDKRDERDAELKSLSKQIRVLRRLREKQEAKYRAEYEADKAAGKEVLTPYYSHPEYKKTGEAVDALEKSRTALWDMSIHEVVNDAFQKFAEDVSNTMPSNVRAAIDSGLGSIALMAINMPTVTGYMSPKNDEDEEDGDKQIDEEAEKIFSAPTVSEDTKRMMEQINAQMPPLPTM